MTQELIDWKELSKRGLVVRINNEVLHPLGIAVMYDAATGVSAGAWEVENDTFAYNENVCLKVRSLKAPYTIMQALALEGVKLKHPVISSSEGFCFVNTQGLSEEDIDKIKQYFGVRITMEHESVPLVTKRPMDTGKAYAAKAPYAPLNKLVASLLNVGLTQFRVINRGTAIEFPASTEFTEQQLEVLKAYIDL